jgi:zinc protease
MTTNFRCRNQMSNGGPISRQQRMLSVFGVSLLRLSGRIPWPGFKTLLMVAILFLFALPAHAGLKERVFEAVLANGLKILLLEDHKAPVVTFQVWYRVGSRNEEWGKTGLSHMLEHMMFKGTKKVGSEEFSRIIQENGGNDNAFTSNDYTAYFENIASHRITVPVELEADRMENLILTNEDFLTERMVVMEERRLRTEDNPQAYMMEQLEAAAFQIQPYHWPTVGWMQDIERFTIKDLRAYHRIYYNPANAFLVVVGDFRKDDLLPLIERAFSTIGKGPAPDQKKSLEEPQTGERRVLVKREALLPSIIMAYHVPNLRSPDSYVLEVVSAILSSGKSSRLYHNLVREKQLVRGADAENSLLSRDPGLFYLSADLAPDKEVATVEKALGEELERLQKEPVTDRELEKAKNQIEAAFVYGQDSLFFQAMLLAQHEIASDWKTIDDYLPAIRGVTPDDIMRVTKRYLVPDNRTVGILFPLPPREGKPLPSQSPIRERITR